MKTFEIITPEGKTTMESPDWECAQATCDAMDWKLEGELMETVGAEAPQFVEEKKEKAVNRKRKGASYSGGKGLSNGQKATLSQLAKSAFDHMDKYGLIEGIDDSQCKTNREKDWRHMIVKEVTGRNGLTTCNNSHFSMLEAEFLKLGGKKYDNPKAFQTGKQSRRKADTMEARETAIHLIDKELTKHAKTMGAAASVNQPYVLSIARAQNKTSPLVDYDALITLPANILEKLLYTVRNRIAAKEGRGETKNRNKGQNKKG